MAWVAGTYWLSSAFVWWLLPVAGSLIVAVPLSVWSSRVRLGRAFRERRLLLIPDESNPPRELRLLRGAIRRAQHKPEGFRRAGTDPLTNALVCAAGHPRTHRPLAVEIARRRLCDLAVEKGPAALSQRERNALLSDPITLTRLHHLIWTATRPHLAWWMRPERGVG